MKVDLAYKTDPIKTYDEYGFAVVSVYDNDQAKIINDFGKRWIYELTEKWIQGKKDAFPLELYHVWGGTIGVDHDAVFKAVNRHTIPELNIKKAIINEKIAVFMKDIGIEQFNVWDEGLGWLAFRFIRPGMEDGYPFSRKAWGPAKNVISCWIPIIGRQPAQTIKLIPGSHKKEYEKYLPKESKFMKDEYRLVNKPDDTEVFSPDLDSGEVVFYHPMTLHSEDVLVGETTRLSLELRLKPF